MNKPLVSIIALAVAGVGVGLWKMADSFAHAGALGDTAVAEFHVRFNSADDASIHNDASPRFRKEVSLESLRELNAHIRSQLGKFESATRTGIHLNSHNGDATLELSYAAKFTSGPAQESFLFDYNGPVPRLLDFHVESKALEKE